MKRPYYIPPIITAGFIALGFLATAATIGQANSTEVAQVCAMEISALEGSCAQ
ncbi:MULTISPECIES: hypothetical protein [unclassified Marinovum]